MTYSAFFLVSSIFFHAYKGLARALPRYLLLLLLQQGDAVRQQLDVLLRALATDPLVCERVADRAVVLLGLLVHLVVVLLVWRHLLLQDVLVVLLLLRCEVVLLPGGVLHKS